MEILAILQRSQCESLVVLYDEISLTAASSGPMHESSQRCNKSNIQCCLKVYKTIDAWE